VIAAPGADGRWIRFLSDPYIDALRIANADITGAAEAAVPGLPILDVAVGRLSLRRPLHGDAGPMIRYR
jgi:hypothetical protein